MNDIGWAFPPEFTANGENVKLTSYENEIQQALRILLTTQPGERESHPFFGCDLSQFLFESVDDRVKIRIEEIIKTAIQENEPRIRLQLIEINQLAGAEQLLRINLSYIILDTNREQTLTIDVDLSRGAS